MKRALLSCLVILLAVGYLAAADDRWPETSGGGGGGPGSDTTAIHDNTANEINAISQDLTPDATDYLIGEDGVSGAKESYQIQDLPTGAGADNVEIDGVAATNPDFRSEGDIDTIRCTGPGAPDLSCPAIEDVIYRYNANSIQSGDFEAGAVDAAAIGTAAVGADEIGTDAVAADEIAAGAVGNAELGADAVTTDKIAANGVTGLDIAAGSVGNTQLAGNAVTSDKIFGDTIAADDIAADAVGTSELANGVAVVGGAPMNDACTFGGANLCCLVSNNGSGVCDNNPPVYNHAFPFFGGTHTLAAVCYLQSVTNCAGGDALRVVVREHNTAGTFVTEHTAIATWTGCSPLVNNGTFTTSGTSGTLSVQLENPTDGSPFITTNVNCLVVSQ